MTEREGVAEYERSIGSLLNELLDDTIDGDDEDSRAASAADAPFRSGVSS